MEAERLITGNTATLGMGHVSNNRAVTIIFSFRQRVGVPFFFLYSLIMLRRFNEAGRCDVIKRLTSLFIVFIILFTASCVFAGELEKKVRVYFDGEEVSFRVTPQFYNGRLVVPVRPFMEALGTNIAWDKEQGSVVTAWENKTIVFHVNHYMIEIDGERVEVDAPAVIVAGTTMMPLRIVSELFGLQVLWDGEKGVVEVESNNYVPFRRLKESDELPSSIRQWVEISKPEYVNTTLEFDNHLYILSSLGWKPSGGYDNKIRKVTREDTAWRVSVEAREPLPGHSTIQVISYPYDLVCLDLASVGRPSDVFFLTVNH